MGGFRRGVQAVLPPCRTPGQAGPADGGAALLKHVYDLSDEAVVERWVENAYRQFFYGFEFFQHEMPIDARTMPQLACPFAGSADLRDRKIDASADLSERTASIAEPLYRAD